MFWHDDVMNQPIRFAQPEDAAGIHGIYAPFVRNSAITFDFEEPTVEAMAQRINATLSQYPWLVYEASDGGIAGFAYASALRNKRAYQWTIEPTIYLDANHRGQGVGRQLYEAMFNVLRLQGYIWAYACLTSPGQQSAAFHKKLGFEPIATFEQVGYKLGRWWDVAWWRRAIQRPCDAPAPPVALPEVWHDPAMQQALNPTQEASND
jgi:phosphinothricin acetyltransferase